MRRILILVAATALAASLAAGPAGARGHRAKLELRRTRVGRILVDGAGFTLYAFTKDRRNRDVCARITACLGTWPPLTTSGRVLAGPGVKRSLIGTIRLRGGVSQVTYAGHPLYTYVADTGPAETFYINILQFGGRWPALNAAGGEVK